MGMLVWALILLVGVPAAILWVARAASRLFGNRDRPS